MTTVAILPVPTQDGTTYQAISGDRRSVGKTAGEALDAMTAQLPQDDVGALVVVQHRGSDRFFTAEQRKRLGELMECWRTARNAGRTLSADEQGELEALVEAEVRAAGQRAAAILKGLTSPQ